MIPTILLVLITHPIMTEIMLDPLGPESGALSPGDRNEFIEIFNPSEDTINIARYKLRDNNDVDSLVPFVEILRYYPEVKATTKIPPQSYGVILDREYVIEGENFMPYELPDSVAVITTMDADLGNGLSYNDTIALCTLDGQVVSSFGAGSGFPLRSKDGISFERKYYFGPDVSTNWRYSDAPSGNTCGFINSVSRPYCMKINEVRYTRQGEYDVKFFLSLLNMGVESLGHLRLFFNFGESYPEGYEDKYVNLPPDSSSIVDLGPFTFTPGNYVAYFRIQICDAGDSVFYDTSIGFFVGQSPVVINEIMYNADVEWVEVYNCSKDSINLLSFSIGDPVRRSQPVPESFWLQPDGYVVFSPKPLDAVDCLVLANFPSLNNTGDTVFLYDVTGSIMDMVPYLATWGGGSNLSLERLSYALPSDSRYNWGSSKEGSTPGRKNSLFLKPPESKAILSLSSKVLAPGRGIPVLMADLEFPKAPVYVTAEMYRIDGRKVTCFFENKVLVDGRYTFVVQPEINRKTLDEGMYILLIKARTPEGETFIKRELIGVLR